VHSRKKTMGTLERARGERQPKKKTKESSGGGQNAYKNKTSLGKKRPGGRGKGG